MNKQLKEDGVGMVGGTPVNNAGGGEIAGIGVGPKGEPGVGKRKKPMPFKSFFKRKYLVQHVLTGPANYDFSITNPTDKYVKVKIKIKQNVMTVRFKDIATPNFICLIKDITFLRIMLGKGASLNYPEFF